MWPSKGCLGYAVLITVKVIDTAFPGYCRSSHILGISTVSGLVITFIARYVTRESIGLVSTTHFGGQ